MWVLLAILNVFQVIKADPSPSGRQYEKPIDGIVGGDVAVIEDFPHMVSLEYHIGLDCAGSIVSDHYVVTSAVCAKSTNYETKIRARSTYWKVNGTEHKIDKIKIHESYSDMDYVNNIGLIRVLEPFKLDETRKPIKISNRSEEIPAGTKGIVSGWGEEDIDGHSQLHQLNVTIVDYEACKKYAPRYVHDGVMCATNDENQGENVCNGSWGDSLIGDGRLAGIQSWVRTFGSSRNSSGYTKISHYRDWINKHIWE